MAKLSPRQIEVLTELFEGTKPDRHAMTPAQRTGRNRVIANMTGYDFRRHLIESRTREITLYGLMSLEPHYPDKARIAAAIEARSQHEDAVEAERARNRLEKEQAERVRIARRNAELIQGYRRILADHYFNAADTSDNLVLSLGNAIAAFEARVGF
jgi:hypothetical protein